MTALSSSATAPAVVGMNLNDLGIYPAQVHANLSPAELIEHAARRGEGSLTDSGALNALTGSRTGRSPRDRFIVPSRLETTTSRGDRSIRRWSRARLIA